MAAQTRFKHELHPKIGYKNTDSSRSIVVLTEHQQLFKVLKMPDSALTADDLS